MAVKTGLEGKPWYYGLAVGLGIGALIFGAVSWRVLQPMRDQLAAGQGQLAELQTKIQEGRAAKQQLPKFREEVHQLEMELDKLLRILPARRNTPDLLRRIRSLAEQGDFALRRFTPGQLSDKEFFSEWPIAVSVEGGYHNLALFFDRISRFSRIINVENLEIRALPQVKNPKAPDAANPHTINAKFTAKTFVYKEPEPEDTTAKDKKGKGKAPAVARPTPPPGSPGSEEGPATRNRAPGGPD